ncbi:MAG: SLC13 family permease, partial [Alphaproteobacteria bacterium]|nr:SLC13 family permease [Alphaproteobacteria bacterium]
SARTEVAALGHPGQGAGRRWRVRTRTSGILAVAVGLAAFDVLSLPVAFMAALIVMLFGRVLGARDMYDHIDWPVIVLLGAMIPVGNALEQTGTTQLIAGNIVQLSGDVSPLIIMAILMAVTMTLSDIMNNAATAVIMAPLGAQIATQLGVNPDAFMMAVAIGASSAFLTPIGHQNNMLILGPGGYRFGDFWRMGLPLEIVIVAVATPLLALVFPL